MTTVEAPAHVHLEDCDEYHGLYSESPVKVPCVTCGELAGVQRSFKQATRTQPMTFLGYQAFCTSCQVGWLVA